MLQFTNRFSGHSRKWIPDFFGCPPHFMRGWHYIVGNLHISGMPHIFWRKRTSRQNLWDFKLTTINHLQWTVAIVDSENIRTVFFFPPPHFYVLFLSWLPSLFRDCCLWIQASPASRRPQPRFQGKSSDEMMKSTVFQQATFLAEDLWYTFSIFKAIGLLWSSLATVFFGSLSGLIGTWKMLKVYLACQTYLWLGLYKYSHINYNPLTNWDDPPSIYRQHNPQQIRVSVSRMIFWWCLPHSLLVSNFSSGGLTYQIYNTL